MIYTDTRDSSVKADFKTAVMGGMNQATGGLYIPVEFPKLDKALLNKDPAPSFRDVAFNMAKPYVEGEIPDNDLAAIIADAYPFQPKVVPADAISYIMELFHGPTCAFKDFGARFMARTMSYFNRNEDTPLHILVATSGDTGSAVANGFLGVEGIHVYVLYPKGKVSPIQECQFTTLGKNITAIEVDGVFDDCQALVKSAFMDEELNKHMKLTSANSINVARFLPQAFYYFNAYARIKKLGMADNLVMCVPSGNFGNICAALFGHEMGLPINRFIAANNANDIFYNYLQTGKYEPKPSKQTLANAMDVGDPSNFARIYDLYGKSHEKISSLISGATYSDDQIRDTMRQCYKDTGYILDPHGACGYRALKEGLRPGEVGIFCETAHPAKFKEKVDDILGIDIPIPERLQAFMNGKKQSVPMSKDYRDFKKYLLSK